MNQTWNCQDIFGILVHLDTISIYFVCKSWWKCCSKLLKLSDVQVTWEDAIASCPLPQFANQRPGPSDVSPNHPPDPALPTGQPQRRIGKLVVFHPKGGPLHHLRWEGSVWRSICAVYELPTKSLDPTAAKNHHDTRWEDLINCLFWKQLQDIVSPIHCSVLLQGVLPQHFAKSKGVGLWNPNKTYIFNISYYNKIFFRFYNLIII